MKTKRSDISVELLRIIACLIVVGTHIKLSDLPVALPNNSIDLGRTIMGGFLGEGVTIFFIIMGFFLLKNKDFGKLLKKTFLAILVPAIIYILLVQVIIEWLNGEMSLPQSVLAPSFDITQFSSLLKWNIGDITLASHLWYIISYVQIMLTFPLVKAIADDEHTKTRWYIMALGLAAVILGDIQKVYEFPFGAVKGFTVVTSPVLLCLIGHELYKVREKLRGNAFTLIGGLVLYLVTHAALTFFQLLLYRRDYTIGHVFSWDSSFAILGALGMIVFCLSIDIRGKWLGNAVVFIGKNTFYVYIIHMAVIRKLNTMGVQDKVLRMLEGVKYGELWYTLSYMLFVFGLSLVGAIIMNAIKNMVSGAIHRS